MTPCDCGQYPIYPGSDECRVCDGSYRLTEYERGEAIYGLSHSQAVALAIMCAEEVLPLWKGNDAPVKAIKAAQRWLKHPTERNRKDAAAAAGDVTGAMESLRYRDGVAADAAYHAAHAAAAYYTITAHSSVGHAAYAAYEATNNSDSIYEKVDRWLCENTL